MVIVRPTIADRVAAFAAKTPTAIALRCREDALRYDELQSRAEAVAAELHAHGVSSGSVVGIRMRSDIASIVALFGVWAAGAVVLALNPRLPEEALAALVERAGASAVLQHDDGTGLRLGPGATGGTLAHRLPSDAAVIATTSGTTGAPRAVIHRHSALMAQVQAMRDAYTITPDDVILISSPLASLPVMLCGPLLAAAFGATCTIVPRYDRDEIIRTIAADRATICTIAPAFFHDMLDLPVNGEAGIDLSSVRAFHYGATPTDPDMVLAFERRFGVNARQGYGSTEVPNTIAGDGLAGERRYGSAGRALPFARVVIESSDGVALPPGAVGEITIEPNVEHALPWEPMIGYLGDHEGTARVLSGGRLRMGDLGYLDDDGFLFVVARAADVIIRGGINVYPREIEPMLLHVHGVIDAMVAGAPDRRLGQVIVGYIQVAPGAEGDADRILRDVNALLPSEKRLAEVIIADALPRDEFGKPAARPVGDQSRSATAMSESAKS